VNSLQRVQILLKRKKMAVDITFGAFVRRGELERRWRRRVGDGLRRSLQILLLNKLQVKISRRLAPLQLGPNQGARRRLSRSPASVVLSDVLPSNSCELGETGRAPMVITEFTGRRFHHPITRLTYFDRFTVRIESRLAAGHDLAWRQIRIGGDMAHGLDAGLLEAVLDSWAGTICSGRCGRAGWRSGRSRAAHRSRRCSHMHYARLLLVLEEAPEFTRKRPEEEWAGEWALSVRLLRCLTSEELPSARTLTLRT